MSNAITVRDNTSQLPDLESLQRWGKWAKEAQLLPPEVNVPQAMALIQAGTEMGIRPLQALRTMSFIKGRMTMSVQLQLALARERGLKLKSIEDSDTSCTATLELDGETVTCTYTLEDAKKAGLMREGGNWGKYPRQMLRWRAIGDALRLLAPGIVMGLVDPDEAAAMPTTVIEGGSVAAEPEPEICQEAQDLARALEIPTGKLRAMLRKFDNDEGELLSCLRDMAQEAEPKRAEAEVIDASFSPVATTALTEDPDVRSWAGLAGVEGAELEALASEYGDDRAGLLDRLTEIANEGAMVVLEEQAKEKKGRKKEAPDPLDIRIAEGFGILGYDEERQAKLRAQYGKDKTALLSAISTQIDLESAKQEAPAEQAEEKGAAQRPLW